MFRSAGSCAAFPHQAIGVSGQQHGFVPLDAAGAVLAPAKLWCDTSTAMECGEIMAAVGGAANCIALAGNPVLTGYTASKLPWTRRHRPEVYARLATIMLPHDFVNFWLTGEQWMEHGDASGTGWLDVRTGMVPAAAGRDGSDAIGRLPAAAGRAHASFRLPRPCGGTGPAAGVRVSAGGGDNMMAAIAPAMSPGVLSVSLGNFGHLVCLRRPTVVDAAADGLRSALPREWLPLICTMNCTVATDNVARALGSTAARAIRCSRNAPGADGVAVAVLQR